MHVPRIHPHRSGYGTPAAVLPQQRPKRVVTRPTGLIPGVPHLLQQPLAIDGEIFQPLRPAVIGRTPRIRELRRDDGAQRAFSAQKIRTPRSKPHTVCDHSVKANPESARRYDPPTLQLRRISAPTAAQGVKGNRTPRGFHAFGEIRQVPHVFVRYRAFVVWREVPQHPPQVVHRHVVADIRILPSKRVSQPTSITQIAENGPRARVGQFQGQPGDALQSLLVVTHPARSESPGASLLVVHTDEIRQPRRTSGQGSVPIHQPTRVCRAVVISRARCHVAALGVRTAVGELRGVLLRGRSVRTEPG